MKEQGKFDGDLNFALVVVMEDVGNFLDRVSHINLYTVSLSFQRILTSLDALVRQHLTVIELRSDLLCVFVSDQLCRLVQEMNNVSPIIPCFLLSLSFEFLKLFYFMIRRHYDLLRRLAFFLPFAFYLLRLVGGERSLLYLPFDLAYFDLFHLSLFLLGLVHLPHNLHEVMRLFLEFFFLFWTLNLLLIS